MLIFDLGGGTLTCRFWPLRAFSKSQTGDTRLGGEDFDAKLVDFLSTQFLKSHKDVKSLTAERSGGSTPRPSAPSGSSRRRPSPRSRWRALPTGDLKTTLSAPSSRASAPPTSLVPHHRQGSAQGLG